MSLATIASACLLGLVLGCRHAFEPDHLAAVAAMVADAGSAPRTRAVRRAALVGALWGLGHTVALVVVTTALALLRAQMPAELTVALELGIGILLVALGMRLVVGAGMRAATAGHEPAQLALGDSAAGPGARRRWRLRPLLVGLAHGLAGSGALAALVAAALEHPAARVAHVALFGLGSTLGMAGLSAAAGLPVSALVARPRSARWLRAAAAAVSIGTGLLWSASAALELLA